MKPINICHIITGLNRGGAEHMLVKLVSGMDRQRYRNTVISMMGKGVYGSILEHDLGIPLYTLGMKAGSMNMGMVFKLAHMIRSVRPDLLQGWMYHGDIAASVGRFVSRIRCPVLWNIRGTLSFENEKPLSRQIIRLHRYLDRSAAAIIYNSRVAARQHEEFGVDSCKTAIIPNGFDTDDFSPRPEAQQKLLQRLGVPATCLVLGLSARFHKMKDFETFLQAASLVVSARQNVVFVLTGTDVNLENAALAEMINDLGLQDRLHLLGDRADMQVIIAGLDCLCLSSAWGEGFPNVIGEAMSCGVPCVVTDVGDSASIVGPYGRVVPPRDPDALAAGLLDIIGLSAAERTKMGNAAREKIIREFALPAIVRRYESLYESVVCGN